MPRMCRVAGVCLLGAGCLVSGAVGTVVEGTDSEGTSSGSSDATTLPSGDVLLDVGTEIDLCQAFGGQDEFGPCKVAGPPGAFEPELQWSWDGEGDFTDVFVAPLVANLTDDDENGVVDLCDVPDIVALVSPRLEGDNLGLAGNVARIFVLDGYDGTVHAQMGELLPGYTPALGDLDADGIIEIVAVTDVSGSAEPRGRVVVFHADGSTVATGTSTFERDVVGAIALGDLDADGTGEIIVDRVVMDAAGRERFAKVAVDDPQLPVAADLDDDGRLEVVWGYQATDASGNELFGRVPDYDDGYPHLADFDEQPGPEILVTSERGLVLRRATGEILIGPEIPKAEGRDRVEATGNAWRRPAAIHDVNGDGLPEIAMSVGDFFMVIEIVDRHFVIALQKEVAPQSEAASTAFDFLADGHAEALYADRTKLWMYDPSSRPMLVLSEPHTSITRQELPIVADVDNDGSAEIVVVSNRGNSTDPSPAVQVYGERFDRWVPARRIWNQHTYHITNIEEDGRLPSRVLPVIRGLNTFRTNVQIEGGVICKAEP